MLNQECILSYVLMPTLLIGYLKNICSLLKQGFIMTVWQLNINIFGLHRLLSTAAHCTSRHFLKSVQNRGQTNHITMNVLSKHTRRTKGIVISSCSSLFLVVLTDTVHRIGLFDAPKPPQVEKMHNFSFLWACGLAQGLRGWLC